MDNEDLTKIRHSLAHILAHAVRDFYPNANLGMGPAIEGGFYYDFGNVSIKEEDLAKIEKRMRELVKERLSFKKETKTKKEVQEIFRNEPYKLEMIEDMKDKENFSVYRTGDFVDLCEGPHIEDTSEINPDTFILDRSAGAYFKGSEKNEMLQRIYGLAFNTKKELDDYIEKREEARERDHRKIGKELELFMFDEEVGQGLPLYLPKGGILRHLLMDFAMNVYLQNGYEIISTPHIAREELWERSGHLKFYKDDMYGPLSVDGKNYRLKPMNCPFHVKMYKSRKRSYKELPIRWTEMGTVYRYEKSGEIHGLTRPRGFTQDDAHIFCTKEQLEDEITTALEITRYIYRTLEMENLLFKLSIRDPNSPDEYFGENEAWKEAENSLKKALESFGATDYVLDEGGASFYAPKIDIDAVDAMGRSWQLSTIQVDFNLTSRFEMTYIDEKGEQKTPFMIHRALLGSIERFLGVYIEHTKGDFPFWLAPVQVWVIPVSQKATDYGEEILQKLRKEGMRGELKESGETLAKTIRNGEIKKIPYLLVVGEKEKANESVSIRYGGKDEGVSKLNVLIERLKKNNRPS